MRYLPAVAFLIIAFLVPAPAHAAPEGIYYLQSVSTGLNLSQSGTGVAMHRPKGNEDHQQWSLRGGRIENTDTPGSCLGKSLTVVTCSGDTTWTFNQTGDQWDIPGLTLASRWYLTPVSGGTQPFPADPRLDEATFLTSHNAYANGVDGGFAPPFANLAKNQTRGVAQQLNDGVRGLMLDIHQTSDGAILCHNSCTWVSKPVALWVDVQRVVDFLRANPSEIVTIFLEDYVSSQVLGAELARVNGLSSVLFRPDQSGVRENGWPKLSQMRASGKRLLIFTDHSPDGRDAHGVMYQRDWTVENYWSMGGGMGSSDWSCYSRWDDRPLSTTARFQPLFVMNHFRDVPFTGTATTDNSKLADRAQRFCQPAARKKPTYLAVDHYNLGNAASAASLLNTYAYRP
ncbi:phospholipase [Lentzea tibetensis]|uniref:Phospholipase n=1 Tax=Lentzea tibetensis TaxID=2591470 RepID=A0A563EYQ4_9PSEU|nr:PI-PLC domain-containing protein [Lentzea tibetensis]TWP52672.1 phospholipase [Lentzea tibetensis]